MNTKFHYDFSLLPELLIMLYSKLHIAVVYGGDSTKDGAVINRTFNPRHWKSYESVACDIQIALQEIGFQHVYLMADDMTLISNLKKNKIDLVWLNTGGVQGYNSMSHTVSLLEMLGLPYIGHNPLHYSILDNKHLFKYNLHDFGLLTSPFIVWDMTRGMFQPERNSTFQQNFNNWQGPFIVKPVSGRASKHVYLVDTVAELPDVINDVYLATQNSVLIEKFLPGREYCVAVYGYIQCRQGTLFKTPDPFVFAQIERVLGEDEPIFTSMDKKAITAERARILKSEEELPLRKELDKLAKAIYLRFNLRSLIRLDIRADNDGTLYVLEANPKPDLKKPTAELTSLIGLGLEECGMSYNDLILAILADRLDYLFTHQSSSIFNILSLAG